MDGRDVVWIRAARWNDARNANITHSTAPPIPMRMENRISSRKHLTHGNVCTAPSGDKIER
jgi:hypothetical protein